MASLAGRQGHVGLGLRILRRPDDGVHEPKRLNPLFAGEGADHVAPERLRQDIECFLRLGEVNARGETVGRDPRNWRDDRLSSAFAHATQNEPEQLPHLVAALLRAGWVVLCLIALHQRGNRFLDHTVLRAGDDR
jgi:hypothetical protein